jgi:hypothetical protein
LRDKTKTLLESKQEKKGRQFKGKRERERGNIVWKLESIFFADKHGNESDQKIETKKLGLNEKRRN